MDIQEWDSHVNTRFYGQDGGFLDNKETIEFKSGRKIAYLKNSIPLKTHTLLLTVQDKGMPLIEGKTEFEWFLHWYQPTIKSGTLPFYLTDIISGKGQKAYKLVDTPGWDSGQRYKEISIKLEETGL